MATRCSRTGTVARTLRYRVSPARISRYSILGLAAPIQFSFLVPDRLGSAAGGMGGRTFRLDSGPERLGWSVGLGLGLDCFHLDTSTVLAFDARLDICVLLLQIISKSAPLCREPKEDQ